jgi:methyltransferase (TIGR00027 family)
VRESGSQTALMVAAFRGRASAIQPPLCTDPWAQALAGPDGERLADLYGQLNPHATLWMGVRTRFLDDLVCATESKQVVTLGAGLDTRAARLARAGLRFFEVDHPHTQAIKKARLAELPGYPVDAATYASCDFETQAPLEQLAAHGFDPSQSALVIWEGVVPYLTEPAIRATLSGLAHGLHPDSLIVFDTISKKVAQNQSRRAADQELSKLVGEVGEPFRFGLDDPTPLCADCGLMHVRSVSFDQATLSITGTYERQRAFRFQSFVLASRGRSFQV